jgi:hypothetical protein
VGGDGSTSNRRPNPAHDEWLLSRASQENGLPPFKQPAGEHAQEHGVPGRTTTAVPLGPVVRRQGVDERGQGCVVQRRSRYRLVSLLIVASPFKALRRAVPRCARV